MLRGGFFQKMPRANDVCSITDDESGFAVLAARFEAIEFLQHCMRIHHNARRNHGLDVALQNAGRQQAELIRHAVELHGVPGIVSALIANDEVMLFGQDIDDLALRFVAPLKPND